MKPRIEMKGPFIFVGLETETTIANNVIPKLWEDFTRVYENIPNMDDPAHCYGVCGYVEMDGFTENTPFHYMAAASVSDDEHIPDGMLCMKLPARRYAMFTHVGSLVGLNDTYEKIYGEWLPASREEVAAAEELEVYGEEFDPENPESRMEIWVPLK